MLCPCADQIAPFGILLHHKSVLIKETVHTAVIMLHRRHGLLLFVSIMLAHLCNSSRFNAVCFLQADKEWDFVDTFTEEEQERSEVLL